MLLLHCYALRKVYLTDSQNTPDLDQITGVEGQNVRHQVVFRAFHSFLVACSRRSDSGEWCEVKRSAKK